MNVFPFYVIYSIYTQCWIAASSVNILVYVRCVVPEAGIKDSDNPDSKVHGANMGPNWGQQDPGGPHVGPMNLAIWEVITSYIVCGM